MYGGVPSWGSSSPPRLHRHILRWQNHVKAKIVCHRQNFACSGCHCACCGKIWYRRRQQFACLGGGSGSILEFFIIFFYPSLNVLLTLLGRGGAESARTLFNRPFLHEKRGLEVPNFVTFPNSLWTLRKAKKIFLVFHSVFGWSRRCGLIQLPPHFQATSRSPG